VRVEIVIASEAKHPRARDEEWIALSRRSSQQDQDTTPHSRRTFRARFAINVRSLESEGAGNAGRPMRPQPRV